MSGKGVRMSAKALARWKEEFKWVDKYPGVGDLAYCTLCKLTLQPKRDKLNVHNNSKSHREMEAQFGNFLIEKVSQSDFDVPSKPVNVISSSTVSLPPVMTSSTVSSAIMSSVVLSSVMTSSPALMTRITSSAVPSTGAATSAVPIIVMTSSSGVMTPRSLAETIPVISEILPHGREDQEVAGEIEEHLVEVHDQSLNNVEGEQIIGDANINIEHRVVLNENGEVILLKTNEEDNSHLQSFDNTPSNVDEIQRQGQRKTEHLLSELEQRLISGQEKIPNCYLSDHIKDVFRG